MNAKAESPRKNVKKVRFSPSKIAQALKSAFRLQTGDRVSKTPEGGWLGKGRMRFETFEPRVLLSADLNPAQVDIHDQKGALTPADVQQTVLPVDPAPVINMNMGVLDAQSAQTSQVAALSAGSVTQTNTVKTWISDKDGYWDDAKNWSNGVVPGSTDNVVIDRGAANPTITIRSGTQIVNSLTSTEALIVSGGSLTLNADSTFSGNLTLSGGTLGGSGAVRVTGAFNVTGYSSLVGAESFTTEGESTVSMASVHSSLNLDDGKNWVNQGTLTVGGDGLIYFGAYNGGATSLTNAAGATLNLTSSYSTPLQISTIGARRRSATPAR